MATRPKKSFTSPRATARNWVFTFGLVRVPVGMTPLYKDSDRVQSNNLCPEHMSPVGQGAYYCKAENHPVPEPVKGYQVADGQYVVLSETEQAALAVDGDDSIALKAYVDVKTIDTTLYENSYLSWPQDDAAMPAYSLIAWNLAKSGKALVGEGVFWGSLRTFVVRWSTEHECLVIHTCHFYAQMKASDLALVQSIKVPMPDEMAAGLANQILDALPSDYPWEDVRDVVADRQRAVIAEKVETGAVTIPDTPFQPGEIPDLIESLKASLAAV